MNYRKVFAIGLMALAGLAIAVAPGLKLTPGTIGNGAVAKWQPVGSPANHVLLLEKMVPTSEFEAAGADIGNIAGTLYEDINELSWKLVSGPTGGGSPRWNIYYGPAQGDIEGYVFLEPAAYFGGVGTVTEAEIDAAVNFVGRPPQAGDVVFYLQVIVDEQERIVLDDLGVKIGSTRTVFSGPGKSK